MHLFINVCCIHRKEVPQLYNCSAENESFSLNQLLNNHQSQVPSAKGNEESSNYGSHIGSVLQSDWFSYISHTAVYDLSSNLLEKSGIS